MYEPDTVEVLQRVVKNVRWLSCAHLQQALQQAIAEAEADDIDIGPAARYELRDLFDVDPEQERSPESIARLKAEGLLPA